MLHWPTMIWKTKRWSMFQCRLAPSWPAWSMIQISIWLPNFVGIQLIADSNWLGFNSMTKGQLILPTIPRSTHLTFNAFGGWRYHFPWWLMSSSKLTFYVSRALNIADLSLHAMTSRHSLATPIFTTTHFWPRIGLGNRIPLLAVKTEISCLWIWVRTVPNSPYFFEAP